MAQLARINDPSKFIVALSFAESGPKAAGAAIRSLSKGFLKSVTAYDKGWADMVKTLPKVDVKYQVQFNMAAMVIKALEDKTARGVTSHH